MLVTAVRSYHWTDSGVDWTVAEWPNAQDTGHRYTCTVKINGCSEPLPVKNVPEAIIRALLDHGQTSRSNT